MGASACDEPEAPLAAVPCGRAADLPDLSCVDASRTAQMVGRGESGARRGNWRRLSCSWDLERLDWRRASWPEYDQGAGKRIAAAKPAATRSAAAPVAGGSGEREFRASVR